MQNLFLINNKSEYFRSLAVIKRQNLQDSIILSIDKKEPFFVDRFPTIQGMAHWADYDVNDFSTSWYWMNNYKAIEKTTESAVRQMLNRNNGLEISLDRYLLFRLTYAVGHQFLRHLDMFDAFMRAQKPRALFTELRAGVLGRIVSSMAERHGVSTSRIRVSK